MPRNGTSMGVPEMNTPRKAVFLARRWRDQGLLTLP
jgi:hypothetical protein